MMDMMTGLSAVSTVIGVAKNVRSAIEQVADAETKAQMAELISMLADVKIEAAENLVRIQELEHRLSLKEAMYFERPSYWIENGNNPIDGPYCTRCFDVDQKAVRLQVGDLSSSCPECSNVFQDDTQKTNEVRASKASSKKLSDIASRWG